MNNRQFQALRADLEKHSNKGLPFAVRAALDEAYIALDGKEAAGHVVDALVAAHAAELALQALRQTMLHHLKGALEDMGPGAAYKGRTHNALLVSDGTRQKPMLLARPQPTEKPPGETP